ncbi:MAG: hypothetical protein LBG05_02835 [Treponema sp.]|nr:hypothetical protein [Treponema sp.]
MASASQKGDVSIRQPAFAHFINGLFGTNYPPESVGAVNKKNEKLENIMSDVILTVAGDIFN